MKKITLTLITVLLTTTFFAQSKTPTAINWITIEEAVALQQKEPRKIIMDIYTKWCGPCKLLDKNTFANADVANYINTHYYAVKFNGEGNATVTFNDKTFTNKNYDPKKANGRNSPHQFAQYLRVNAYPTLVFFDESTRLIAPIKGYQTPQQLEMYLKLFKTDKFKEMTSQEKFNAYVDSFTPTFIE